MALLQWYHQQNVEWHLSSPTKDVCPSAMGNRLCPHSAVTGGSY